MDTRHLWQSQGVAGLWEDTSRLGQVAFALLTDLFLVMKVVGRFLSHWEVAVSAKKVLDESALPHGALFPAEAPGPGEDAAS